MSYSTPKDDNEKHLRMLYDAIKEYEKTHIDHKALVNISDKSEFSPVRNCFCIIDYIKGKNVIAIVDDLTGNQGLKNIDIPINEFSPIDRGGLYPGVMFMWMIGYLATTEGKKKYSAIKMVGSSLCYWTIF